MSSRAAQLAVELTESGADHVAAGLDDVTSSAKRMGDTVESAGKQAKTAGSAMDSAAGGADEMASKGSQAAGAMGGLGELIGGPFGAAMATGGIGLQAMADSGDLLNAALENSVVASARAKAGTIAKTVADKASAGATRVMTVAQKALNIAQRSSPVLLIVTGVLLLVGAIVLAYRKSATFRAIVQGAMAAAKAAVDKVVGAFKALGPVVGKVMAFVGKVVGIYVKLYVAYFKLGLAAATLAWKGIQAVVSRVVGFITGRVSDIKQSASETFDWVKDKGVEAFKALTAPVQNIIDLVDNLLDKIRSIHLPSFHIPGTRTGIGGTFSVAGAGGGGTTTGGAVYLTLNYQAAPGTSTTQGQGQAQAIMDAIDARLVNVGRKPVFRR
jgi:phage-related protein